MNNEFPILGFDIGGTKIAVSLGTSQGKILGSKRIDSKDKTPDEALPELVSAGRELLSASGISTKKLRAVGIGAPAPMDIPNGLILSPPNMKLWKNVAIKNYMREAFGVETFFDNDANAGALAEWIFGSGKGCEDMIYLTMSTGIGGGIIAKGHLIQGKSFLAGEVGHLVIDVKGPLCNCGLKGCYEAFCGGRAVAQKMQSELAANPEHPIIKAAGGKLEDVDMKALVAAVKDKNGYALDLWDEICFRNAQAIGMLINALNPEIIVLGTLAWATGNLFLNPVKKYLPRFCWPQTLQACTLKVSALGKEIGEYSSICVALNCLYERGEYQLPWKGQSPSL